MKIRQKKNNKFFPVMLCIACALSALCFASYNSGTSHFLAKGLGIIITPLEICTNKVVDVFENIKKYTDSIDELTKKNIELERTIQELTEQNQKALLIQHQNDELYKFLELKKERNDFMMTDAKVISRTSSNYISKFTIDKGSFHGISENMPVITSDRSIIGVVYSVNLTSSECLCITSYDTTLGVFDERSGSTGFLSGDFELFSENKCIMTDIHEQADVKVGDKILTSGLGDIYPSQLVVGQVTDIFADPATYTQVAHIKPSESIFTADNVMVITSFNRVYE